jgi:hypothetical protein
VLWARTAARASRLGAALRVVNALPDAPRYAGGSGGTIRVRARSGCVGTSSIDFAPPREAVAAVWDGVAREEKGGSGGAAIVDVPRRTVDELVAAALPQPSVVFLFVKVDASGREFGVLRGMDGLLRARRALSVVVEVNKQHLLRALGLAEGGDAATPAEEPLTEPYDAAPHPRRQLPITEAANAAVSARIAETARFMFAHGFQMLTADRGWWAAQDPYDNTTAAAVIDEWSKKVMRHGELDLWFYLPAGAGGPVL